MTRGPLERSRAFTLAALATGVPSEEAVETLRAAQPTEVPALGPWLELAHQLDDLKTAYAACFDVGKERVPMYETEYGRMRGMSKGKDLADVVGFYRAFGLDLTETGEAPDHLTVELEFYALLLYKQHALHDDPEGSFVVADARQKFLRDHLGGFVRALAGRPAVAQHPAYGPLLSWCADLVDQECETEGVRPAPLDFFAGEESPVACGGCVDIPGLPRS